MKPGERKKKMNLEVDEQHISEESTFTVWQSPNEFCWYGIGVGTSSQLKNHIKLTLKKGHRFDDYLCQKYMLKQLDLNECDVCGKQFSSTEKMIFRSRLTARNFVTDDWSKLNLSLVHTDMCDSLRCLRSVL